MQIGTQVQWTINGADQFATPRTIESLATAPDGSLWAMVNGTTTGLPVSQLTAVDTDPLNDVLRYAREILANKAELVDMCNRVKEACKC